MDASVSEPAAPEWDLGDWEQALTIHVGTLYACRECGNLAVVTRGGLGIMEMTCCAKPMQKIDPSASAAGGAAR